MTKKTHLEVKLFNHVSGEYLAKMKGKENRLCEKIKLMAPQIKKANQIFADEQMNINIDHAKTVDGTPTGAIMKDEKENYIYDRIGEKNRRKALNELVYKTVEIKPIIPDGFKELMKTLDELEKETFAGFVLPPLAAKK